MLEIRKKGNKNFLHVYNSWELTFSDLRIAFNGANQNVLITRENGAYVIKREGFNVSDISVYDETSGGTQEVFSNVNDLANRLIEIGYIAFYTDNDIIIADLISNDAGNSLNIGTDGLLYVPAGGAVNGLPSGGTTGQILKKLSATDYDADWENESGGSSNIEYQTEITTDTTLDGSQKGLNKVYPVNSATAKQITITTGDYVENDVINIERRGQGTVEIVADTGVRIRGVRDVDNRYFINDPNSMVALLCRGSEEFGIIGNLKRGYTGAVTVSSYGSLNEGDVAVDVAVVGTGFSENMIVTVSANATQSSAFTYNSSTSITLHLTAVGVEDDTVTVTFDNGDVFVDTGAIVIQGEVPSLIVYQDDFTGTTIDTAIWDIVTTSNGTITQDDDLELSGSAATSTPDYYGLILKNAVSSANDLIIVQAKYTIANVGETVPRFGFTKSTYDENNLAVFTRGTSPGLYNKLRALTIDEGVTEITQTTATTSGIDVRIKYVPSSGVVNFEYWNGSEWTSMPDTTGNVDLGTSVKVILFNRYTGTSAQVTVYDDFYISNNNYTTQYPS